MGRTKGQVLEPSLELSRVVRFQVSRILFETMNWPSWAWFLQEPVWPSSM